MPAVSFDPSTSVFTKTAIGQQEIQTRSLGLPPLVRRLLVLIDGQRSSKELTSFVPGQDIAQLLGHLVEQGCIDEVTAVATTTAPAAPAAVSPAAASTAPADVQAELSTLPEAEMRGAKDVEMARNFMTNTVNTIFGQHTRLSLIEAIFACKTTHDLRRVYPSWVSTMSGSAVGLKRLPELREKLFKVL